MIGVFSNSLLFLWLYITLFPILAVVQFSIVYSTQNGGEGLRVSYHVNDMNVYQGREEVRETDPKNAFNMRILHPE